MQLACDTLRDAGIRVEGGIFLVRFGWYGGYARMQEQGYHVEAVTDIWTDFIYHMDDEPKPIGNPTKIFPGRPMERGARAGEAASGRIWRASRMREYLTSRHAAASAAGARRRVSGGRRRMGQPALVATTSTSATRATGSGTFPGEEAWPAPEGVLWAALKTAATLPPDASASSARRQRDRRHLLHRPGGCPVGELDNDRYGIVVRSLERPGLDGRRAAAHARHPQRVGSVSARAHHQCPAGVIRAACHLPARRHQGRRARRGVAADRRSGARRVPSPHARGARRRRCGARARSRGDAIVRRRGTYRSTAPTTCSRPKSIYSM